MRSRGFVGLVLVLAVACTFSPENPTRPALPDAGPCGTMGAVCCPELPTVPSGARTLCRSASLTCSSGTCVPCGAAGQPCCANATARDGGAPMDAGAGGACASDGATCIANVCVGCAGPERAVCGGACVPLTTDQNCGACGTTCAAAERCVRAVAGVVDAGTPADGGARVASCQLSCPTGQAPCGNTCRDLNNDPDNCRTCGNQCNVPGAVAGCAGGACTLASCREGLGNCDGNAANGCETATGTDANHCGACGNRCGFANAAATCAAGLCVRGACDAGFADCDGDPANGCEVNTAMGDVTNCGACRMACPTVPPGGGTVVCVGGTCRIGGTVCSVGQANCDASEANGCEVSTLSDVDNCGIGGAGAMVGCGNRCPRIGGVASCTGGVCGLACDAGLGDCDGNASNGCETGTDASVAHCGGCNRPCTAPNGTAGCAAGACTVATCSAGFADCDGVASNGCEANVGTDDANCGGCGTRCAAGRPCVGGACVLVCGGAQVVCSGACRDLATDNANCGACGTVCIGGTVCQNRACSCPAGQAACLGTCRSLQVDNNNCGVCGRVCAGGQTCVAGACTTPCASGQTDCSGTCRDLATDNANCGACGTVCTGGTTCQGRSCACPTGQRPCSGTCRAIQTDNANCGTCGTVCAAGTVCSAGVCTTTCASPTTLCSGTCRDLQNDPSNCNACGTVCTRTNGVAGCAAGACTLAACNTGFGNCDGNATNGCEVNTSTNVSNCGACGNRCSFAGASASCVAGRCTRGTCAAGFANCDGADANGCEVNTVAGDVNNCGGCGTRCPTPPVGSIAVCASSACTTSSVSCATGTADCDGAPGNACEVNVTTTTNCGACGRACVGTNGTATCTAGLCGITCSSGFGNCNGTLTDGCETGTTTSPTNCGGCNTICSLPNATAGCAGSACTIASCNAGFANCDGVASNGCEVNLNSSSAHCGACSTAGSPRACSGGQICSSGVCVTSCGSGQTNCSGACRNLTSDADACGACGAVCSGTGLVSRTCGSSVCNGTCSPGRANCDNNLQTNGCEVDTNTSVTQCGGCTGMACSTSNITPACSGGNCTGTCNVGFADCNNNKRTDGCETSVASDPQHCGSCPTVCPSRANASSACAGGACSFECDGLFGDCDGVAANGCEAFLGSDPHCGACGRRCAAGRTCQPNPGEPDQFVCQFL